MFSDPICGNDEPGVFDVNELFVSLTSYANFAVKGFFSVTVVKEMQVLLTTHKSTNFSILLFLLIRVIDDVDPNITKACFANIYKSRT